MSYSRNERDWGTLLPVFDSWDGYTPKVCDICSVRPAVTFPAKEHCYRLLVDILFPFH